MAIFNFTNPGQYGSAYFTLETVPNSQGFFDSSSFPNAQGYYSNFTNLNESYIVTSSYVFGVVVPPGSSSFEFNPSNSAVPTGSLYFRGTGGIGITVDTYSGSYVVSPSQGYNGSVLNTFPLTPVPNFQARVAANSGSYEALSCQNTVLADIGTRILSSASLLVTPNGYTEGVLFSTLPNSSSGDFTVTRATTATRVNAAGLVELVPYNLVSYSEDFTNVYWDKQFSTVLSNTVNSPINTLTADTLLAVTGGGTQYSQLYEFLNVNSGTTYSISVYAKKNSSNFVFFREYFSTGTQNITWFNLLTGQIGTTNPNHIATIVDVGGGWYRCIITTTTNAARNQSFGIGVSDLDNSYIITATSSIFIWGAQLVEGTNALPYQPTTTRLNISRADYSLGGCPNILLEPQRTNLITWSEEFNNAVWITGSGGTAAPPVINTNTIISPSGVQNADTIIFNRGAGNTLADQSLITQQLTIATTGTYYFSIWLKATATGDVGKQVFIRCGNVASLQAVTLTANWARYETTATVTSGSNGFQVGNRGTITTPNSVSVDIWGAQLELGAYSTSYIPTTSATVTRNVDTISRGNVYTNNRITSVGGTWFVDLRNNLSVTRDATGGGVFLNTGILSTTNNGFSIRSANTTSRMSITKVIGGTNTTLFTPTTNTSKIAIKWNGATADVFVDGVKVVAATEFTSTAMENLITDGQNRAIQYNSMALFPVPLSDSQCIELTGGGYDTPELAYASLGLTSESPLYLNQSVNSLIF